MNYVLGTVPVPDNSLNSRKKTIHVVAKPLSDESESSG